jgi:predicted ATP-grasp superfamily ATP-dependent carboligase
MRALIVGSEHARGSLAAVRALARADWIVGIGSAERRGLASRSRGAHRWHRIPPPEGDPKAFLKATNAAIVEGGYELVFGSGDAEIVALSGSRGSLRAIFPYAPHERIMAGLDKKMLSEAAEVAGLTIPATVDGAGPTLDGVSFPVIVKSRLHWSPGQDSTGRIEAVVARNAQEARDLIAQVQFLGGEPLLQEFVEGDLLAYTALAGEDSKVIADVQQRADRMWPPESGVSVRAVTEQVDDGLREKVASLLTSLDWFGLAQLQFIAPPEGEPRLIDLNGRFYGSMALATAAGTNLPAAWANVATERPVDIQEARPGIRYHWMVGDIRRALVEKRGGLRRDIMSCLSYARGASHSIWSAHDPGPAFSYARMLSSRAFRKLLR